MKLPRRNFLHLAASAAALPAVSRIAWAQAYPSRPVHWIVSFAAGGPNDIVARIVGQYLSDHLGQQFVIENRAGAAGNVGMQSALNSAPDGYTIAFVGPNYAINPALYEKLPFDFIRDSVPVAGIMRLANVMDVNPTFPANNLAEFIAYAKANPGKINFASGGVGTSPHLSGELLKTMAGINLVHVPYRGIKAVQPSPNQSSGVGQTLETAALSPSGSVWRGPPPSTQHFRNTEDRPWPAVPVQARSKPAPPG